MPWKDQLPGGLADDKTPGDFDPEQVLKGLKVEYEHIDEKSEKGRRLALEIALDHLTENPSYYDDLALIEPEHDQEDDGEAEVVVPDVQKAKPRNRVFVEGDDLYAEVGSIADALFSRGAQTLGNETLRWLSEAKASRTRSNPYRARR